MADLQWMGAVRMRVQTFNKNVAIHRTPVHNSIKAVFCKNQIHKDVFNFKPHCFRLNMCTLSIILLSPMKNSSLLRGEICTDQALLTSQNSTGASVMDYGLVFWSDSLKLEPLNDGCFSQTCSFSLYMWCCVVL